MAGSFVRDGEGGCWLRRAGGGRGYESRAVGVGRKGILVRGSVPL